MVEEEKEQWDLELLGVGGSLVPNDAKRKPSFIDFLFSELKGKNNGKNFFGGGFSLYLNKMAYEIPATTLELCR